MMSFKRAVKSSEKSVGVPEGRVSGVKPWVNGLSLVSSGNRELDEILGGGHVVGSLSLLHEDVHSNHADTVFLYSLVEAISQNHKVLLIVRDSHEAKSIISSLPFNMNKGSLGSSLDTKKKENSTKTVEEEEDDKKRHLKIAWQYGKYIKDPVSSSNSSSRGSSYCSSYDLSNRLQSSVLSENMPRVYCYGGKSAQETTTFNFATVDNMDNTKGLDFVLNGIYSAVANFREVYSKTQANPLRVFIPHYESILSSTAERNCEKAVLGAQFFLRLKNLMRNESLNIGNEANSAPSNSRSNNRMTVLATILPAAVPASFGTSCLQTLNSLADSVFGVESFAGHADAIPIEFRFFCGFFLIHKLPQIAVMAPHRPSACRFGLKRDRRKLHIEPLHLPPEDSRASKYQSETSLGVKQDKSDPQRGVVKAVPTSLQQSNLNNTTGGSIHKRIQKINIQDDNTMRNAPIQSASTSKSTSSCSMQSSVVNKFDF